MNIVTRPFFWVSAHREAKFVFDYEHRYTLTNVVSTDGKAVFIFNSDGINFQEIGEYIYITTGIYKGYHKITSIPFSNWYVTETDYIDDSTGTLVFIEDHVFTIYTGYDYGTLQTYLPYKLSATFKPEPNADGQLVVNISGYINKLFDVINSNDTVVIGAYPVYYNLFNRVQLFIDDVLTSEHMAANSAIDMFELNDTYVDTGRDLNGGSLGNHYLSCGESDSIQIRGSYIVKYKIYEVGMPILTDAYFDPTGFDSGFKITQGG